MVIMYRIGEGDPEFEVLEIDGEIVVLIDPRLSLLQIKDATTDRNVMTDAQQMDFIRLTQSYSRFQVARPTPRLQVV